MTRFRSQETNKRLSYTQQQSVRAQLKSKGRSNVYIVVDRAAAWSQYVWLRMQRLHFWLGIVALQLGLVVVTYGLFVAGGEPARKGALLALEANGYYVGATLSCSSDYCHAVGCLGRVAHELSLLLVGALVVVRLSRVVARRRFIFSDVAALSSTELAIRLVSNRPSGVVCPSFVLEYFDTDMKCHPLALTNRGQVSYLNDSSFVVRHPVDDASPFSRADWRSHVFGLRIAVIGLDELLVADCCGVRFYKPHEIKCDVAFADMMVPGVIGGDDGHKHRAFFVHCSRLNNLVSTKKPQDNDNGDEVGHLEDPPPADGPDAQELPV